MKLQLDTTKKYAIALEGGGAKGAYEIGVWKALKEAGIEFSAVSGTSVGALNGALYVMGDLDKAEKLWKNITFSQVMDVNDEEMKRLFQEKQTPEDILALAKMLADVIKNGGFDITPLRNFMKENLDEDAIRKSPIALYIVTYSLSDKKTLELLASDLNEVELTDMLMASAYLPAFRNEKLGGKRYTDGGVTDAIPLHALVTNGYRDIIAVRMYGFGRERKFRIPKETNIMTIAPQTELGSILYFDSTQSELNMKLGYYDTQRMLYGLRGKKYYIDRSWSEDQAYEILRHYGMRYWEKKNDPCSLRKLHEKHLPALAKNLGCTGDYFDLLVTIMEKLAEEIGIDPFRIYQDSELLNALRDCYHSQEFTSVDAINTIVPQKGFLDIMENLIEKHKN